MNDRIKTGDYPFWRWIMLLVLMLLSALIQLQWLTHAAVARPAESFYFYQIQQRPWLEIDNLALLFMVVYLFLSIPASWLITRIGLKNSLQISALLLGAFSLLKGLEADSLATVFVAQLGLAIIQPVILNASTTLADQWFPLEERALANGLTILSLFIGVIAVMAITPEFAVSDPSDGSYGKGIPMIVEIYGVVCAVISATCFCLLKDSPVQTNTSADTSANTSEIAHNTKLPVRECLRRLLHDRNMRICIFLFMVGLGLFNAISSLTDAISASLRVEDSDGLLAMAMMVGGIIGAVVFPLLSDHRKTRKNILLLCTLGMLPSLACLAWADSLLLNSEAIYQLALAATALFGFFVLGAGPVGFQYVAEVTAPVPEAYSQGALYLAGQFSGILMVIAMSVEKYQWLPLILKLSVLLTLLCVLVILALSESPAMIQSSRTKLTPD
ncbi:MFS transporter [Parendozoicomonas haliclonae]|uniref:Major Facilitator Superfamily protein n=1 Tax=Parendozoicomonas haliclonae TaxID=1960125 RepID=A0A1X7APE2_9GAMM|nr:MFS transporter [Parendozoicomonas haliclonae]SMA50125.1 Major Facilitator Superfamily protein [Parendozoicomonas haliclonae]